MVEMDEFQNHARSVEHISKVRAKLRAEEKRSAAYKHALSIAMEYINGDGYPGKEAQATIKRINTALEKLEEN